MKNIKTIMYATVYVDKTLPKNTVSLPSDVYDTINNGTDDLYLVSAIGSMVGIVKLSDTKVKEHPAVFDEYVVSEDIGELLDAGPKCSVEVVVINNIDNASQASKPITLRVIGNCNGNEPLTIVECNGKYYATDNSYIRHNILCVD